jgi:hypothetical protein
VQDQHSIIDLSEWNRWFRKFVKPVFTSNGRTEYFNLLKEYQTPFYPKYWVAEKFYTRIKNDPRFDEELKLFFAFLYSCDFFMENIITFDDWLKMPNWYTPHLENAEEKTILEILKEPNGHYILKNKLRWIPFLNRPDGN